MQEATANVASGAETARQAGRALDEILAAVEGANNQVQLITAAVEEVNGNAAQLADAMASISAITEEASASAEEVSASAGGMTTDARGTAESASLLLQLGSRFKVG